jgi:hypothetical protein
MLMKVTPQLDEFRPQRPDVLHDLRCHYRVISFCRESRFRVWIAQILPLTGELATLKPQSPMKTGRCRAIFRFAA